MSSSFQLFQFDGVCQTVALTLCPLIGKSDGIEPICYARNVDVAGVLIFQPATFIIDIVALLMTGIMIYHIKTKYTAVGRKEITLFFQMYTMTVITEMLLVTSIIPKASILYPYFTAVHLGLITSTLWCLLINGFLGIQFAEDGTPLSLWWNRITTGVIFIVVSSIAIATFNNTTGPFNYESPMALWIIYYFINGAFVAIYIVVQLILIAFTLEDRWPLGDIIFGALFFIIGQISMHAFSIGICEHSKHYMDGLFLGSGCNLLAVMMVYKYWDSITGDDLEFALDSKPQYWQVFEPIQKEKN
ncbi:hypothetical protein LRAMOSA08623 [Lichtheimia ramosa]|uniref:Uncharacterized protein n=1 Tax=Lichtheimia ramosa TaxID=688394 RepID=A0A077WFA6_9FUNG|nr:hypothetical protein LRAMOSA08623 [Lichtheimia ramosa]